MITHSASNTARVPYEENHISIPATSGFAKEHNTVVSRRRAFKWFGAISTVLLSLAALAPNIFRIPVNVQPWVFLVAIFWLLAFCAGMFDL